MLRSLIIAASFLALIVVPVALADGPVYASPQSVAVAPAPVVVVSTDPYGFGSFLNAQRARRGLHALAYDAGLCHDAAVNSSRGLGHAHLGRARRQNAGVGPAHAVWSLWCVHEGHWQAMFDPTVTRYGIAYVNGVWTYGAN